MQKRDGQVKRSPTRQREHQKAWHCVQVGWLSAGSQRPHTASPQPSHTRASTQPLHPNASQRSQVAVRSPSAQRAHQTSSHLKQDSSSPPHSSPSQVYEHPLQSSTRPHPSQLKILQPGRSQYSPDLQDSHAKAPQKEHATPPSHMPHSFFPHAQRGAGPPQPARSQRATPQPQVNPQDAVQKWASQPTHAERPLPAGLHVAQRQQDAAVMFHDQPRPGPTVTEA